jgi:uncharacterized RDD family membrane protein YckC
MMEIMKMVPEIPMENQYAGFLKRLKAFGFDYLLICAYIILLTGLSFLVVTTSGLLGVPLRWPENPVLADLLAFVTLILPVMLYFALQESSASQATWGKHKAGLRVVNADGSRLTLKQAFVRSLVKLIPWQIAHTCLLHIPGWPFAVTEVPPWVIAGLILVYILVGIYIAAALISRTHRTPYDWAAGSYEIEVSY